MAQINILHVASRSLLLYLVAKKFFVRARKHAANQHVAYSVWLEVEKMQRENNREGFTVCGNMHSSLQVY